jgi:hypothetical protein
MSTGPSTGGKPASSQHVGPEEGSVTASTQSNGNGSISEGTSPTKERLAPPPHGPGPNQAGKPMPSSGAYDRSMRGGRGGPRGPPGGRGMMDQAQREYRCEAIQGGVDMLGAAFLSVA